jgi:hypothetical protein
MEAGYSGTPLLSKLGIRPEMKIRVIHEPEDYEKLLHTSLKDRRVKPTEIPDLVHLFAINNNVFEKEMHALETVIRKNPSIIIWVSWYKKSAKIATDLTEDVIRNYALRHGLVDIKVCAVSEIWSGLKLVVPLRNR